MASKTHSDKIISDVEDCIIELQKEFLTNKTPINDDSIALHRFEEKVEYVLQHGMKEKLTILGAKKSYWDYICVSFSTSKRAHDGLKYVKSMSELKTSLGRGRAFIRFCLMHKCLADTLQSCFTNYKSTSEYYFEKSVPVQKKLSAAFIASLYDLNEVNFDLTSRYTDLDISWPAFARKLFVSSEDLNVSSRNHSISSFQSFSSQNDLDVPLQFSSDSSSVREQLSAMKENKNNIQSYPDKKMDLNESSYSDIYEVKSIDSELDCSSTRLNEYENSTQHVCSATISDSAQIVELRIKTLEAENHTLLQRISILESLLKEKEISSQCNPTIKSESETSENSNTFTSQESVDFNKNHQSLLSKMSYEAAGCLQIESECPKIRNCNSPALNFHKESKILSSQTANEIFLTQCSEQLLSKSELNNAILENNISTLKMGSHNSSPVVVNERPSQFETIQPKANFDTLLQEMKTIIFDFQSILPDSGEQLVTLSFLSRLKNIRKALEINLVENNESLMYEIQNKLNEQYIGCIKSLVMEQDKTIDTLEDNVETAMKLNETLYSKICTLRDLLHSYGLLKISGENDFALKIKHPSETTKCYAINSDISSDNGCFYNMTSEPLLNSDIMPLLSIYKSASSKLRNLNGKVEQLHCGLESSQELNDSLLSRVQDQELRLKGVTKELEEAQVLVSVLNGQHKKLQSAEGILKYDLQEKRKLLTRLRNQLESTREDWNRVRQKNSKSEAEWQDLRKEFVLRHKQASEESGFIDDKGLEEQISISRNDDIDQTSVTGNIAESSGSSNTTVEIIKDKQEVLEKKTRLEIMEEQCQLLYSSLLRGARKRQELDDRLESMCRGIERPLSENSNEDKRIAITLPAISSSEGVSDSLLPECAVTEELLDDRDHSDPMAFSNDIQVLSEMGSLNSNCSISPNIFCSETNLLDTDCTEIPGTDICLPLNICINVEKENRNEMQSDVRKHLNLTNDDVSTSLSDSAHEVMCVSDYEDFHRGLISDSSTSRSSSVEPFKNEYFDSECKDKNLTQVDSLLIKKKDLEKCLEHYEIHKKSDSSNENSRLCKDSYFAQERKEFIQKVSALKNEKEFLQQQVLELENKVLLIEAQLNQTSRQLVLSKLAKDQEVAAVQFQLNTEALKYEKALQQFTEQNIGLEDMKQKVSDQEQLIFALEEALTEIRLERECEKEHQWQDLEEIQFALMAREEECLALSENLEKMQELKARDKDAMEVELFRLQSDSRELRKKLIKLVKEKDLLWKRTDHLSHLQKVQVSDRWMNDAEVSNCLGCKNRFSFILRKHHCRLCGRIFCHSCSNNWLPITASRHRSRVCNECYMLHTEMEKEARRGSDIPCVEDDSEDEAVADDLSINPMSDSSFNSEVPHCMNNSIISLPARSADCPKSSPLFSSAPDLRCVVRQEDVSRSHPKSMIYENLSEEDDKNVNSDILSDEENTKSLSASSSCNDTLYQHTDEKTASGISMTLSHTTTEIEATKGGITGELWINAEMICDVPITCENPPTELHWSFTCDSKTTPITFWYKESDHNSQELILCSSEHKMDDRVKLSLPGFYVIRINNSSRSAQKVAFTLKVKRLPELDASS